MVRVVRMVRQLGVHHLGHRRGAGEELHHLARVLHVARHAQVQRLDALQDLERGHRRHARAEVAQALAPRAQQERSDRRFLGEVHVVEPRVRRSEFREAAARGPVEAAGIDHQAADHDAVAAEKLGRRVEHEVRALLERPLQIRR